mgnify:FL=1
MSVAPIPTIEGGYGCILADPPWYFRTRTHQIGSRDAQNHYNVMSLPDICDMPVRDVAARQGGVCTYCGTSDGPFDLDHIYPVSRGGSNEPSNLTLACASCNRSKGARTLREWLGR